MTMSGKEKLYFLLDHIIDAQDITPSGKPLLIDPTNDLNRNYRDIELSQLFTKLEKDEKVLKVIKAPSRTGYDGIDIGNQSDDGCWHIELLPSFAEYFFKIQSEPEYFEFTGRKPTPIQNEDSEIDQWLEKKDEWAHKKIWQVVSVLNSEWQLRDEDTFKIPTEKFVKDWVDNERELEAILTNLHNRKIIEVSRKTGEIPPSDDPVNKPGGASIWEPITDNAEIIHDTRTQIEIFPERFGYLVSKLKNLITERSKSPTTPQRQDIQEQNRPLEAEIDLTDTSSRRAYEKKWDVLQAIWDVYESHSRPDSILVPVARLTIKDRSVELIDGIVKGLKSEGLFQKWDRKDRWYNLEFINHEKLPEVYKEIGSIYKNFATIYQEQSKDLTCGNLRLDLAQSVIKYKDSPPTEISTGINIIKLLIFLMENRRVVEYIEIAQKLKLNCYHEGVINKDVAREVQFLRRDLGDFLVKIGITKTEVQGMFISKKNVGYKLRCTD